jgi:hypothetical protein
MKINFEKASIFLQRLSDFSDIFETLIQKGADVVDFGLEMKSRMTEEGSISNCEMCKDVWKVEKPAQIFFESNYRNKYFGSCVGHAIYTFNKPGSPSWMGDIKQIPKKEFATLKSIDE